ncbi:tail fiber protein [Aquimarina megaterium]|uniref:tail fiber protein n=1 Tax=Aquimarina megaterium TaxID=1443666 RepID=UPI0009431E68|nr:tail fiber protein [Aquimarina megaterium]
MKKKLLFLVLIGCFFNINAQDETINGKLTVNENTFIGNLNTRNYLNVISKEWPEVRFQTPTSDRQIRLGVAHEDNSGYGVGSGDFYIYTQTSNTMPLMVNRNGNISLVNKSGNVGIGTTEPDMKLTVKGNIHAEEVKIDLNVPAPDYVFKKDYKLRTIKEVEKFIIENSHLPEIPSAKEFEKNGIMQAEMDMDLLKKVEELTLYTIQQEKQLEKQSKEIERLKILVQKLLESKK